MVSLSPLPAVGFFCFVAAIGVVAHELSHAIALRAAGVPCRVEVLPTRDGGGFRSSALGPLARVSPTSVPENLQVWRLRVAAMMPLCLVVPVVLIAAGVLPVPSAMDSLALELAAIAWIGCSLPSPQDFSLLWYPERAMAVHRGSASAAGR